jgi:hypothetical protein
MKNITNRYRIELSFQDTRGESDGRDVSDSRPVSYSDILIVFDAGY